MKTTDARELSLAHRRELRLRRKIDELVEERDAAIRAADRMSARLASWTHCGLCGAPARGPYCFAHAALG